MKAYKLILIVLLVAFAISLSGCGQAAPPPPTATPTPHPGASLVSSRCTTCHTIDTVTAAKYGAGSWSSVVERMVSKGAQLDKNQQSWVVEYLAATYPAK